MSPMLARLISVGMLIFSACHVARIKPAEPTCYDNAVVSCESCTNRHCTWCAEGPNPSDGYCCASPNRCANPIREVSACVQTVDCDHAVITSCDACLARGCAWCPGETRCHARGQDGTFPGCAGQIAGALSCPAASPGAAP